MRWDEVFALIPSESLEQEFEAFLTDMKESLQSGTPMREDFLPTYVQRLARLRYSMARHVHAKALDGELQTRLLIELGLVDKLVQDCLYTGAVIEGRRPLHRLSDKRA